MTRDLATEGPVTCCPWRACLIRGYKGGTWGTEGRPE